MRDDIDTRQAHWLETRLGILETENAQLRELLQQCVDAFVQYQMDADGDPPYVHRQMMEQLRSALQQGDNA
jgi:hypothetical protein